MNQPPPKPATLGDIVLGLRHIYNELRAIRIALTTNAPRASAPTDDRPATDLDTPKGDFEVKKNPPRWQRESFVGKHLSECSVEFLDELASFITWQIEQDVVSEDPKQRDKVRWKRLDRGRVIGWAARLRAGWKVAAAPAPKAEEAPFGPPPTFTAPAFEAPPAMASDAFDFGYSDPSLKPKPATPVDDDESL